MVTLNFVLNVSIRLGELEDGHVADRFENLVLAQRCVRHVASISESIPRSLSWGVFVMVRPLGTVIALTPSAFPLRAALRALPRTCQTIQRADERGHRRLQSSTELREHLLARRHRRQLLDLRGVDRRAVEHAALHRWPLIVLLGEVREDLRGGDRVLRDHDAGRTLQPRADAARSRSRRAARASS